MKTRNRDLMCSSCLDTIQPPPLRECGPCRKIYGKHHYEINKSYYITKAREWDANNPDYVIEYRQKTSAKKY